MNQKLRTIWLVVALTTVVLTARVGCAAPDDEEEQAPDAAAVNQNFRVEEANFDQWVFQGAGNNAKAGRDRINARLKIQLDELDRVCGLTDAQKQKLALAAKGDTKRFFDQVEEVRQKFLEVRNDQNRFNQIWQDIQPLQRKQASGLFGERSFFARTLHKTLDPEQTTKYQAVCDERRHFRYRASIEVAMTTLENTVALRNEQREAIIQILVDKTNPPLTFGQYDHMLVMYRLASVADKDVKPLLDERQWGLLERQLNETRGMKLTLIENNVIDVHDGMEPAKTTSGDNAGAVDANGANRRAEQ